MHSEEDVSYKPKHTNVVPSTEHSPSITLGLHLICTGHDKIKNNNTGEESDNKAMEILLLAWSCHVMRVPQTICGSYYEAKR